MIDSTYRTAVTRGRQRLARARAVEHYRHAPSATIEAARQTVELTANLPARLTPSMRAQWRAVDGWATDEQQDAIFDALLVFAGRAIDG